MKPETIQKRIEELITLDKQIKDLHHLAQLCAEGTECELTLSAYNRDKQKKKEDESNSWQNSFGGSITIYQDGEEWKEEKKKGANESVTIDIHDDFMLSLIGECIRHRQKRIEYLSKRYIK